MTSEEDIDVLNGYCTMIFILLFSIVVVSLATKISYRNYRASDANEVAKLCCDVFDGPFQPYDILAKNLVINNHRKQLEDRYNDKVNGAVSHAMIVGTTNDNEVISFLEVGLLPSPIPVKVEWNGVETDTTVDVPYLGNVLVSETYRRQGIGSNLIKIGLKVAEKWKYDKLYLAVDIDNTIAFDLYKKIGFQVILDERDLINRNLKKKCRIFMAKDVAV